MITFLLKTFFSFLFPPSCIICAKQTRHTNICDACTRSLPLTREFRKPWLFSLYQYRSEPVTKCIHHIKTFPDRSLIYKLMSHHQYLLTRWTHGMIRLHNCTNIILIPTPIHRDRFLDRGYNQSEIIAQAYQHILHQAFPDINTKIRNDVLIKSISTDKQALITNRKKRLQNIQGAFSVFKNPTPIFENSLIIIIDDVTTTGGTLQEMYDLFPNKNIVAFTLAH